MNSITIDFLANHQEWIPELAALIHQEWINMYTWQGKSVEDVTANLIKRAVTHAIPLNMVAFCQGKLVGSITLKDNDMASRPDLSPWIAAVFVVPECRGNGFGKKLIAHAEMIAKNQFGVKTLYLYTAEVEQFYKKIGFTVLDRPEHNGKSVTLMKKNLL